MPLVRLQELRDALYGLLLATTEEDDREDQLVHATQKLGVTMTKAVQRDGVNIIQLQNVKVIGKVTMSAVQALREVDALEVGWRNQLEDAKAEAMDVVLAKALPPPIDAEATEVSPEGNGKPYKALMALCGLMLDSQMTVQDMVKVIRYGATQAAKEKHGTTEKAAKALGIQPSYFRVLHRVPDTMDLEYWAPDKEGT